MFWLRRILPYVLAASFAAGSLLLYLRLASKSLPPVEVLSVVPETAHELWFVNDLAALSEDLDEHHELATISGGLVFFLGMDFDAAAVDHSWVHQARAVAWRTGGSNDFTLAWGFPGGWSQSQCEQWCIAALGAAPVKNGLLQIAIGERTAYVKIAEQRGFVAYDEPTLKAADAPVSPLVGLLSIGTKRGVVHVNSEQVAARHLPWMEEGVLKATVVRDVYFPNQRISGEEIVMVNRTLPKFTAMPEEWLRWIPSSVTSFMGIGLESGYAWVDFQQELRATDGRAAAWNGELAELETRYSTDAESFLGAWWNGGMASFTAFGRSYLLLGSVDAATARRGLESVGEDALPFLDGSYVAMPDDRFLVHLLGAQAQNKVSAWVSQRAVVLADSEASLLKLAARLAGEKAIDAKHILGRAIASGEHMVVYLQSGSDAESPLTGIELAAYAGGPDSEATHIVYSGALASPDRLVTRFEVSKAATVRQQTRYLWEFPVAGLRHETLTAIRNHTDNTWYTLVQDSANVVHAISATGKAMWTYNAGAHVIGRIEGVDLYKNGKIQSTFATTEAVHAIDLLGRKVDGFPIRVKSSGTEITTPLFIADYDNNRNYRFIFATSDGELHNHTADGKATRGWNYNRKGASARHIAHLKAGNADYLFVAYADGKVDLLKRNGEPRYASRLSLPMYIGEPVFRVTSDIARSSVIVTDTSGAVVEGVFGQADGSVSRLVGAKQRATGGLLLVDLDRDRVDDLFYTTDTSVVGLVSGLEFNRSFRSDVLPELRTYQFAGGMRIGVVLPNAKEFYLLEQDGTNADGFPLFAGGVAVVRDLTGRGGLDLITSDGLGLVMAYRLE